MFTFGGTVSSNTESGGSGSKKLPLAIAAAVVIIAAGGYAAWMHWGQPTNRSTVSDHIPEEPAKAPIAIRHPETPIETPVPTFSAPDTQTTVSTADEQKRASKITSAAANSPKPSSKAVTADEAAETKQAPQPLVIRNNSPRTATQSLVNNDAPIPPSMAGIAPAGNGGGLPNLIDSQSKAPTPVLQTLSVSQGVSQGLLVKKVQPKYPPNSLRLRVEGGVQMLATISKTGDISAVKVLSGDPQLSHAAVDAVKQWKYKPYLLNGLPVEIQTQITVNFKLPN
jgi:TonB family protein